MKRKLTAFAAAFALAALAGIAHAQQTPAPQPAKAENAAERKPIYYRNPMGLPDTSPVPKKDWMGMDYIPVYEGEAGRRLGTVKVSLDKVQRSGVRTERAEHAPARAAGPCAGRRQARRAHAAHRRAARRRLHREALRQRDRPAREGGRAAVPHLQPARWSAAQVDYRIAEPARRGSRDEPRAPLQTAAEPANSRGRHRRAAAARASR